MAQKFKLRATPHPTLITIGHGAYSGANRCQVCTSKAFAVQTLVSRGVPRDAARQAVNDVMAKPHGYATVRVRAVLIIGGEVVVNDNAGDVVEVRNSARAAAEDKWPVAFQPRSVVHQDYFA